MAAPVNDDIGEAITITGSSFTYSGSTTEATSQSGEPGGYRGSSFSAVWFKYIPSTDGVFTINTNGSDYDTVLNAYASTNGSGDFSSLTDIGYDDDGGGNVSSALSFSVTAGSTYYIQAGGYRGDSGALSLSQSSGPNGLACYASGTRIETARGLVAVEDLRAGDVVRTVSGRHGDHAPVKWIGYRQVDLLRHPRASKVQPVRFTAGSLGEGLPVRDLVVSPDHCMWIDGALIPAHFLVNGQTIVQETHRATVTYWHVELEQHDVLVAEGAASESYLDTGNRHAFSNGGATEMLHADFEGSDSAERLVPRLPADGGEIVRLVRARLAAREVVLAA